MNKDSKILIIGHNDIIEQTLDKYFQLQHFKQVYSSSRLNFDSTIQPSVYDFFSSVRPEYVFLGSAKSGGIEANQKFGGDFIYHNLSSVTNVVYAAQKFGVKKLLYLGSSCVYPKETAQPMKEESLLTGPLEPTSEPYAVAKIAGIKLCQAYRKQHGLNAVVAVPATIYGPGSDDDAANAHVLGALLGKFHRAVVENQKEVVVWGSGKARREFLFADDFLSACLFLIERDETADIINVGCGYDISIQDLALKIKELCGFKGNIVFDSTKPDGAMVKLLDNSRLHKMGWKAKVGLDEGLRKTYEWYKNKK